MYKVIGIIATGAENNPSYKFIRYLYPNRFCFISNNFCKSEVLQHSHCSLKYFLSSNIKCGNFTFYVLEEVQVEPGNKMLIFNFSHPEDNSC